MKQVRREDGDTIHKKKQSSVWWPTPVISAFWKLKQEENYEFKVSLVCIARPGLSKKQNKY